MCDHDLEPDAKVTLIGYPAAGKQRVTRGSLIKPPVKEEVPLWLGRIGGYAGMSGDPLLSAEGCVAVQVSTATNLDNPIVHAAKAITFGGEAVGNRGTPSAGNSETRFCRDAVDDPAGAGP